ncbi:MAG: SBBP repeat-containing protein [candidate division WOR-3 bacterium]
MKKLFGLILSLILPVIIEQISLANTVIAKDLSYSKKQKSFQDLEWINRYNELISGIDCATAITIDSAGNIYITGWSGNATTPDYLTMKVNEVGQIQWLQVYDGPNYGADWAYAIAVDNNGNVYVTGESEGNGTNTDFATIKYDSNGNLQWVRRYNGSVNGSDFANGIAVDRDGNVYVSGTSDGGSSDYDYLIVKYNAEGIEQWVVRYNGSGNGDDFVNGMVIDNLANVYITGESENNENYDYVTIKYNSNGQMQWLARYDGVGDSDDYAYAIAIDSYGNVYVTGASGDEDENLDYVTIKYNSEGIQQWLRRYDGVDNDDDLAYAIAVDNSGNVYVTGISYSDNSNYDCLTIKYNTNGVRQWLARYNGPNNSWDYGLSIKVDNQGNVYVVGDSDGVLTYTDFIIIKYNSLGNQQWVRRYNGNANNQDFSYDLQLDFSNNVIVAGSSIGVNSESDFIMIKYNNNGIQQWTLRFDGEGNSNDEVTCLAIDQDNNLYVAGTTSSSGQGNDFMIVKYTNLGELQWSRRYNSTFNKDDNVSGLALDNQGNVYVAGESYTINSSYDIVIVKYNSDGILQWTQQYNGPRNGEDWVSAVMTDNSGNIYLCGGSEGIGTDYDFVTIKYNANGVLQWLQRYNGNSNSIDYATALTVDRIGNVYVTGVSYNMGSSYDYLTIKYNTDGIAQWVTRYDGPANLSDASSVIKIDQLGNVYVTGRSYGIGTNRDYATIKYSNDGQLLWIARYDGLGNSEDIANALVVDSTGNVYVTGSSIGQGTARDWATVKYNSQGQQVWVNRYSSNGAYDDVANAMILDGAGNLFITGYLTNIGSYTDYLTLKYNRDGVLLWSGIYNGTRNRYDYAKAIVVNDIGNIYVSGTSEGVRTENDFATIKYNPSVALYETLNESSINQKHYKIYPNPTQKELTISSLLPLQYIKVYDVTGQIVREYNLTNLHQVKISLIGLCPGIYFINVNSENTSLKFVITK